MPKSVSPASMPPRIQKHHARPLAPSIRRRVDALLDRLLAPAWPPAIWPTA